MLLFKKTNILKTTISWIQKIVTKSVFGEFQLTQI